MEIGGGCEEPIRGGSLDELVEVAAAHAAETHGLSSDDASSQPVLTEIRAFIPQTSRPRAYRALSLSFINK
jgi:predicted small metal-binding protein